MHAARIPPPIPALHPRLRCAPQNGGTPLAFASSRGHAAVCKQLLQAGASMEADANQMASGSVVCCFSERHGVCSGE